MLKRLNSLRKPLLRSFSRQTVEYKQKPYFQQHDDLKRKFKIQGHESRKMKVSHLTPIKVSECFFQLNLNRGSTYNYLTPVYMQKIKEYLQYYTTNSFLKTVYLRNFDKEIFSLGTNFQKLREYLQKGETQKIINQLEQVNEFTHFTASYPKPIIQETEGLLTNSAIPAFLSLTFNYSRGNTTAAFNSIDFNFIPHGGETYYLSQMPHELGFYFALTGNELDSSDL